MCSGSTEHDCTQCEEPKILYEYKSGGSEGYFCDSLDEDRNCKEGYFPITETKSVIKITTSEKTITHEDLDNEGQLVTENITVNNYEEVEEVVQICAKCHDNCKKCSSYGTDEQQNCEQCIDNYYYKENDLNSSNEETHNCYKDPENYYLDENDKIYKKCQIECKYCLDAGSSEEMKCTQCIDSYYFKLDKKESIIIDSETIYYGNCYTGEQEGYAEPTNEKNEYVPCYEGCLTCSKDYTNAIENNTDARKTNFYCLSCDQTVENEKYYFLINTNSCFKEEPNVKPDDTSKQIHYFIQEEPEDNEAIWKWVPCYERCTTCYGVGDYDDMKCLTCEDDYFMLEDKKNCHNEDDDTDHDDELKNYLLVSPDSVHHNPEIPEREGRQFYRHCNVACKKCLEITTETSNTKCESKKCTVNRISTGETTSIEIEEIYGYLEDNTNQCYLDSTDLTGYVFVDENDPRFLLCDEGCKTCIKQNTNNCTSCLEDSQYYEKIDDKQNNNNAFHCYYHPSTDTTKTDEAPNYYLDTNPDDPDDGSQYLFECYEGCSKM